MALGRDGGIKWFGHFDEVGVATSKHGRSIHCLSLTYGCYEKVDGLMLVVVGLKRMVICLNF